MTSTQAPIETGLVWFRRDLRLSDNPAFAAATARCERIVALFVVDRRLVSNASPVRRDLLIGHLTELGREINRLGGRLVVRYGDPTSVVPGVVAEAGAAALFRNADYSRYAVRRDEAVDARLTCEVSEFHGSLVHRPGDILTRQGAVPRVFTPFHRLWAAQGLEPWPEADTAVFSSLPSDDIPAKTWDPIMFPGERAAAERLDGWLDHVDSYGDESLALDADGSSQLSADLKFGTIAARSVLEHVGDATQGRASFVRQIAWRDWYAHTMAERPHMVSRALRSEFDAVAWRNDEADFESWSTGRTGYPIVDAGMRQLVQTGWIPNRIRMIGASFLVKDLLIDWRMGGRFFRRHLVDADPAQNVGNWQWVAGVGPDAAPYFRVFNPILQSRRFDSEGHYLRRWLPELSGLETTALHDPSAASPLDLLSANVVLGDTYPQAVVDHAAARRRCIDAFELARAQAHAT